MLFAHSRTHIPLQTTSEWSEHISLLVISACSQPLAPIALDYPPFFAYFEKLLSIPAALIDPQIVKLENLNYDAWSVIAYQRTTVILTELVLGAVLVK
jgi:hypothetical protein